MPLVSGVYWPPQVWWCLGSMSPNWLWAYSRHLEEISFTLIFILMIRRGHNFAHATTAELSAVVACAKLWPVWMLFFHVRANRIFTSYGLWAHKPFVRAVWPTQTALPELHFQNIPGELGRYLLKIVDVLAPCASRARSSGTTILTAEDTPACTDACAHCYMHTYAVHYTLYIYIYVFIRYVVWYMCSYIMSHVGIIHVLIKKALVIDFLC